MKRLAFIAGAVIAAFIALVIAVALTTDSDGQSQQQAAAPQTTKAAAHEIGLNASNDPYGFELTPAQESGNADVTISYPAISHFAKDVDPRHRRDTKATGQGNRLGSGDR